MVVEVNQHGTVCYTLDLEHDYAGVAPAETYETLANRQALDRLAAIVRRHHLKLTVFATGLVLEQHRDSVRTFEEMGAEIELHGYSHSMRDPDFVALWQRWVHPHPRPDLAAEDPSEGGGS